MADKVNFLHLNVNKSFIARDGLKQLVNELALDIICLNEPYVLDTKTRVPDGYTEIHSDDTKYLAAFWLSDRIPILAVMRNHDMVAIRVSTNKEEVLAITNYCLPSTNVTNLNPLLDELNLQLLKYPSDNVVLMCNFNAKSSLWGQGQTDCSGRMVTAFASNADL